MLGKRLFTENSFLLETIPKYFMLSIEYKLLKISLEN